MKKKTQFWLKLANQHARTASAIEDIAFHEQACRFAQLSADCYLRALLHETGGRLPNSPDMMILLHKLEEKRVDCFAIRRSVRLLNRYSTDFTYGYPGYEATRRQAHTALLNAKAVEHFVRSAIPISKQ